MTTTAFPRSVYADTAGPAPEAPPLTGEARTGVAIVGGGFTGLSTALHLAEAGIEATVLEAHEPGWGASGRNGGQVNPGLYPDPDQLIAEHGADRGRRMLEFAAAAPDTVFDLVRRHAIACEAEQTGTLRVAFNADRLAATRSTFDQLARLGLAVEWLDRDRIAAASGTTRYLGGIRFPRGGKLNPLAYARGLAAAAGRAGARIHGGSPALSVARQGSGWLVTTPTGRVVAERVVLATNGYTGELWPKLRQSVVPVYSTIAATAPLDAATAGAILPSGSVLYEVAHNTVYYRLDAAGRLLMGGRSVQHEPVSLADARRLTDYAVRLWPQLAAATWTHAWNGLVAITAGHRIHLHEPAPGLHACLGYNGRGVAMATAMGGVLARRIAGASRDDLPMPVSDIRPIPFHGLAGIGVALRLTVGGWRDRLGI